MATVAEWLATRKRQRLAEMDAQMRQSTHANAIRMLMERSAELQARCDLLEQAVDALTAEQHGSEILPIGTARH